MLNRRRVAVAGSVLAVVIAVVVGVVALTGSGSGNRRVIGPSGGPIPQPSVPRGWVVHVVGAARVAIPDHWGPTTAGVVGNTVAIWTPGPQPRGTLPTRCVVQERPHWLLTYLNGSSDWAGALQRDLTTLRATTAEQVGPVAVANTHSLVVHGAVAALAFTAQVRGPRGTASAQELDSADLLAALRDGTEVHVFCSGPAGTLPAHMAEGVDSTQVG